ncbi:unnamed protein product [Parnassius apollo]|uniref:(apollo) hypothetical protein n=1 Tax=Parnassius apollo TaxID=110799 RepID=A0A8S3Y7J5_PARAO|nr:unnamed protein product [Parnassius apollo]
MDPLCFHGKSKHVNIIPGDGNLRDDDISSNSDDDFEPNSICQPQKRHISDLNGDGFEFKDNTELPEIMQLDTPAEFFI